ncbi:MAG: hypothetical protein ACO395_05090 [Pontimonas sp.]
MIQPFNPQIDQQVSQYQQASAMNQPGPRQTMAPQDRRFAEDQQDDNFMLGMAQIGSTERTWANKNQLDFQNAENQRSFMSAEGDKQRAYEQNIRQQEIDRDNQRAQKLSEAMTQRARLRLESMKRGGTESLALLEESNALDEKRKAYEAGLAKANMETARELGQDVSTPMRNRMASLESQLKTVEATTKFLNTQGSTSQALLEANYFARLRNYGYTDPTKDPGWFSSAEDLKPSVRSIADQDRLLVDYGQNPVGAARGLDSELMEGVTIDSAERMSRDISETLARTMSAPGIGLKDATGFSQGISRLLMASTINVRGDLTDVQSDVKAITDDLMRQGVSPHVLPAVLSHLEEQLNSAVLAEFENLGERYPSMELFGPNGEMLPLTTSYLSQKEAEDEGDIDGQEDRYRYNAMVAMANGLRRARTRVEVSGYALGTTELTEQLTMIKNLVDGADFGDEDQMFTRLSSDSVAGSLSRENFGAMLSRQGFEEDFLDTNLSDGDQTDLERLNPFQRELYGYLTNFEGVRRGAKSKSRDLKKQNEELSREDEALRLKRARQGTQREIDLAEEMLALGIPEGLGIQDMMLLFGGME